MRQTAAKAVSRNTPMLNVVPAFERIGEENAFAVLARATELASRGRDIINLGIGQPDFPTPPHIVEAAIKALRDGHHGYTPAVGVSPLRQAGVAGLARHPDVAILSDEIYGTMTYDSEAHVSFLQYPEVRDRLIYLDGASKTYAMTGWRLGWSVWPKPPYDPARKRAGERRVGK